MKKAVIVYHRVDYDGLFSCLIAKKRLEEDTEIGEIKLIGHNYSDPIPNLESEDADYIILVDISFPPDYMKTLAEQKRSEVTWIDHHYSSLKNAEDHGYSGVFLGRQEVGKGAVELTWEYMYPGVSTPKIIRMLSSYDVWNHDRFDWEGKIIPLQYALKAKYGVWLDGGLTEDFPKMITHDYNLDTELIEVGKIVQKYEYQRLKSAVKSSAFPVLVGGKYSGICMLGNDFGSTPFRSVAKEYQIFICMQVRNGKDGKPSYSISMYQDEGNTPLNLAEYGAKYGFAGHPCACGYNSPNPELFYQILEKREL